MMNKFTPDAIKALSQQKWFIVTCIIALALLIILLLVTNRPTASKQPSIDNTMTVEALRLQAQDYPIIVAARGSVEAVTRSNLVAQVRGEIIFVSPKFNNGGTFKKGETLLKIDDKEFVASAANAEANYLQVLTTFQQEEKNAAQAIKDWQRLNFDGEPNELVLRKPQLKAAEAQLKSAKANMDSAKLNLRRTRVAAPYDGFTVSRNIDLGQYVGVGTMLGQVVANKGLEVSLPLTQDSYAQIDTQQLTSITLSADFAGITHTWPATLVRSDKIFDSTTRQLNIVAGIDKTISKQGLEIKIGQFVNADIAARTAKQSFVIPNRSLREGKYIFIYKDGLLEKRSVNIVWQDNQNSIITNVSENELLVLTSLAGANTGTKAKLLDKNNLNTKSDKP